ncbi:Alkane 1-monooxygenase 1 [compost metagenome]
MVRDWAYCLALLHPMSVGLGLWTGGYWIYTTIILGTVVYPAIEILGKPVAPTNKNTYFPAIPEFIARLTTLIVITVVASTIITIPHEKFTSFEKIVLIYNCGLTTGIVGIVLAHEMIHRGTFMSRHLGTALMLLSSYPHFKLQHLYSHHPNVATGKDHSSAQHGQSLYKFYIRSIFFGGISMWKRECARSAIFSGHQYHPIHNRAISLWIIQSLVYIAILLLLGPIALVAFIAQGVIAVLVLETVNYMQHYGLNRNGGSRKPSHSSSWDNYSLTNYALFNLGHHSDHHVHPAKPFHALSQQSDAPVMPYGYFTMAIISLFPPLWRWILDKHSPHLTTEKTRLR